MKILFAINMVNSDVFVYRCSIMQFPLPENVKSKDHCIETAVEGTSSPKAWSLLSLKSYALVSGKPRNPIPGECGTLAGDFSGF